MDCQVIQPELVAYHFGVVADRARDGIERHLLGCGACLQAFLALKRAVETAPEGPRPSEAARARLRRAVEPALAALAAAGARPRRGLLWRWRAGGLAVAAAGVLTLGLLLLRALAPGPPARGRGPLDDSARPVAASGRIL